MGPMPGGGVRVKDRSAAESLRRGRPSQYEGVAARAHHGPLKVQLHPTFFSCFEMIRAQQSHPTDRLASPDKDLHVTMLRKIPGATVEEPHGRVNALGTGILARVRQHLASP
jgi:hypothetical protein